MAKKKISELPAGGALNGTELVPIVQTGTTKRITAQDIANLGNASGVEGSGTINRLAKFTATSTIGNSQLFDDGTSVGLGTITPLGLLHLFKASATTRLVMDGNASQSKIITYRTNGLQRFGMYVNNTPESGSNVGSDFQIRAYNDAGTLLSTPLFIKRSTGNVGIGTTAPASILDVNGVGAGAYTVLNLQNSQARAAGVGVRINLQPNSDFSGLDVGAGISAVNTSGTIQNNTDLIFESGSLGTGNEVMRITSGGNVGIGTSTPLSILETKEANRTNGSNITNVGIYSTSAQDTGVGGTIGFGGLFTGSDYAPFGSIRGGKENNTSGNYAGYLAFQTIQNGGSLVERGRIASSGNVLIGTTTDGPYKLDVNGTARVSDVLSLGSNTNYILFGTNATVNPYIQGGSDNSLAIGTGNTSRLTISPTGAATFSSSVTANGDLYLQNSGRAIVFNSNTNNNTQIYEVAGKIVLYTGAVDRLTIASNGIATFASSVIISTANNINPADNVNTVVVGNVGDTGWRAKGIGGSAAANHNWTIAHNALNLYFGISNGVTASLASWLVVSPSGAATFSSSVTAGGSITIGTAGNYAAGSIYSDGNWGMIFRAKAFSPNYAHFMWATAGDVELMRIASSGNLLINTTTDSGYKLDVQGNAGLITINTNGALLVGNQIISGAGTFAASSSGTDVVFNAGGTRLMTLKAGGNVLIGTTTDAGYKLDVNGVGRFTGGVIIGSIEAQFATSGGNTYLDYAGTLNIRYNFGTTQVLALNSTGAATFSSSVTATNFIVPGGTSAQFLKANGSVDSNTYATTGDLAAYLPLSGGTITGDLTVNSRVYVGTNGCYFQEVLIGSVYELQVVDSAGNKTVLS